MCSYTFMNDNEWDDNEFPLAYLITIRTFGTWLHGDGRGSVDRHGKNIYGTPRIAPNARFSEYMKQNTRDSEFLLDARQRAIIETAIREVCSVRGYGLKAINVRTNHAHSVVSSKIRPELMINAFKANSTRELRANGLVDDGACVWSRGGSRRYLWKPHHVDAAINYVLNGQGDDLPEL